MEPPVNVEAILMEKDRNFVEINTTFEVATKISLLIGVFLVFEDLNVRSVEIEPIVDVSFTESMIGIQVWFRTGTNRT